MTNSLSISEELLREVEQQANHVGMPMQEWVSSVLAQRVRLERETEEFFRRRAAGASDAPLGVLLDKATDRQPDPGDEL